VGKRVLEFIIAVVVVIAVIGLLKLTAVPGQTRPSRPRGASRICRASGPTSTRHPCNERRSMPGESFLRTRKSPNG